IAPTEFVPVRSSAGRSGGRSGEPRAPGGNGVVLGVCLLWLLVLSTLLGNALVCLAIVRFRHLRAKVTNWFVLSLASSDLCVALLVMPWQAVTEAVGGVWLFGTRFCDTWVAADIMCSTASILHLCIISLDRYWAIASPFRYERRMTRGLASAMIALAWTLSVLISFIPVQLHWHRVEEQGGTDLQLPRCDARLNPTYAITSSLVSFYIPVSIMIGTYARIYRIAQAQIRRISSLEKAGGLGFAQGKEPASSLRSSLCKETKVLQTLSIIVGVFVCCWLPFFVLNCLGVSGQALCVSQTTFRVFMWLGWANSSVNPVIYAFNVDFRKAFSSLLGCRRRPCWAPGRGEPVPSPLPTIAAWHRSLPHTVSSQGEGESNGGALPEKEMLSSHQAAQRSNSKNLHLLALLPSECEAVVSLETLDPFAEITGH
uniref:G-protein coupled receptors family 1 profile domain-containing protein n=1 Tax=Podarcis muralis TaxID=64176 RepID=A0A670HSF3_PODMU